MKSTLGYFWKYIKIHSLKLWVVIAALIVSTFLTVKSPEFIGEGINELGAYIMGSQDKSGFFRVIMLMIIFAVASWVFNLIQNVLMSQISGDATNDMRKDLFEKLEGLPIEYFDKSNDGDILSRFTSDLDNISNTLNQSIHQIMVNTFMLVVTIIMMFMNHVELSFVVLSMSPLIIGAAIFIIKQAQKFVILQQKSVGEMNGYVDEQFSGQKLVIANGLHDESRTQFHEKNEALFEATFKGQFYSNVLFPTLQGLSMLSTGIVIFYGAWMTSVGRLPIAQAAGTIFLFTQYVRMIYQPLSQIASQYTQMQLAFAGASRIMEVLQEEDEKDRSTVTAIDGIHGDVNLVDVSFGYDESLVLHGINISADKGQMVALVGHTGSGKTTIMNLLNRFYDVRQGRIEFDGRDIRDISLPTLRKHVGIVLQDSVLFTGTIRDNIAFGDPQASQEAIERVAKQANVHDFIMTLEDGYDTIVSESNSRMSVGQKQLISIARTMLVDPDLLILDEATSNVDTVTEADIQQAMDVVIEGRTSFVIAHRLKTILKADKIVVLENGRIIEEGTHESLLADGNHYAELYNNQFVFETTID
ncbi:ABC transporter ATP-binding protein [Erysipelothrix sp. HDW6B]|uniref:ABC transporter ATP-binding protein n=1 Tax=Erysipelothrix sp. HDW6B TaxID=2714929 RepID=UPI001408C0D8|nr:ABC transporter ATP-binding protein [Erysipelothrix sp. HDW6B]QIK85563.1 ABC transporter ATP-binding protein [Erysipelothrix sp. HDW6B]